MSERIANTPRTDAALDELADDQRGAVHYNGITFIHHAQQLEREVQVLQRWKDAALQLTTESSVQHVLAGYAAREAKG